MRFKNRNCIVTGGTGFIGTHLSKKLIDEGAKVLVVSTHLTDDNGNIKNVDYHECDIRDIEALKFLFRGIDTVFHMAALPRIQWCIKDPIECHDINATGTLNVLEAARSCGVNRLVNSSSYSLYAPGTPYYVAKLCAEEYATLYSKLYGLSTISLRYATVYGSGQSKKGPNPNVIASLSKSKEETGRLWITGDGTQSRDFTHVSDIVEANILSALSDWCGVLDICTGVNTPLIEVAKYFDCPIDFIDEARGDEKHVEACPKEAKQVLGWEAKVPLEEGIKDVIGTV